jgi:flagellar biosynthetic protein FliO
MIITVIVIVALALVGLTMINVDPAQADLATGPAGSDAVEAPASDPSLTAAVVKMVSALAVVIAVVYAALYALRKLMGRKNGARGGRGSLELLETTYVGQRQSISLVRVGERSVLVGVTERQISTLTELDADETAALAREIPTPATEDSFSRALSRATGKLKMLGLKKKQAALET